MKVRMKKTNVEGSSSRFNMQSLGEVLVGFEDDYSTIYIKDLDVFVNGAWKDLQQAFKDKDIIPDKFNSHFAPPADDKERERGYYL